MDRVGLSGERKHPKQSRLAASFNQARSLSYVS